MPSFLSKVFGRKKDEKSPQSPRHGSGGSLLEGKFEAVSPTVSPSATDFPENSLKGNGKDKDKDKDKDGALNTFRVKSRRSSQEVPQKKKDDLPQLSLVLPVSNEQAVLDVAFQSDPSGQTLSNAALGTRKLNPSEALILVRTCSQAIIATGLETLGVMHPHWYSASADIQHRLISLFIRSLNPQNTTLSPSSSLSTSIFESEVNFTHSPHDVAAVLRWGLRHFELDGSSFGKAQSWYRDFAEGERNSEYSPKAYSEKFTPLIPPAHLELLNATLDLFSSLASHAENNGTSGSRLSRTFGFWLLAAPRVEENEDWSKFYARWQRNGRILEHLFLARIRDEALRVRMPTRLTELVAQYPHIKGSSIEEDVFLRPRLSTRQFDALFVRVETEFSSSQDKVRSHPLQLIKDAFVADVNSEGNDYFSLWDKLRKEGNQDNGDSPGSQSSLGRIFADETIRYLSLVPGDHPFKKVTSPTISITEASHETRPSRRQVSSPVERSSKPAKGTSNGHAKPATDPTPLPSVATSPLDADWSMFTSTGFSDVSPTILPLATTLFGQDVEKTNPPFRKPSKRSRVSSPARSLRKSLDVGPSRVSGVFQHESPAQSETPKLFSKTIPVSLVQIDEAFVEFWVDALLDPISSNWPTFVLCKLKSSLSDLIVGDKRIEYLILEHIFVPKSAPTPIPTPTPIPAETTETAEPAHVPEKTIASSPKSSIKSEKRFFGFFTSSGRSNSQSTSGKGKNRISPQAKVNEFGERLKEEDDGKANTTVKLRVPSPKSKKSADLSRKSVDAKRKSAEVTRAVEGGTKDATAEKKEEGRADGATAGAVAVGAVVAGAAVEAAQPLVLSDEVPKTAEGASQALESAQISTTPAILTEVAPKQENTEEITASVITPEAVEQQTPAEEAAPAEQFTSAKEPAQEPPASIQIEDVPAINEYTNKQLISIAEEPAAEATIANEPADIVQEAESAPAELPSTSAEPIQELVVTEVVGPAVETGATEETVPVEEPSQVEEPVVTESTAIAEEPSIVEEPLISEEPVEQPRVIEEPNFVEEPLATEEPIATERPLDIEEPTVIGEREKLEDTPPSEGAVVSEEPAKETPEAGELLAAEEPLEDTIVEMGVANVEPIVVEEPVIIADPIVEESEAADEPSERIAPVDESNTAGEAVPIELSAEDSTTSTPIIEEHEGEIVATEELDVPEEPAAVAEEPALEPVIEQEQASHQTAIDVAPEPVTGAEDKSMRETSTVVQDEITGEIPEPTSAPAVTDEEPVPEGQVSEEAAQGSEALPEPLPEPTIASSSPGLAEDSSAQANLVAESAPTESLAEAPATEPTPEPEVAEKDNSNDTNTSIPIIGTIGPMLEPLKDIVASLAVGTTSDEGQDLVPEPSAAPQPIEPATRDETTSTPDIANGNGHHTPAQEKEGTADHEVSSHDANHDPEPTLTQVPSESAHSESPP